MATVKVVWDIFAYFPCNASGVRVGVRKTVAGAERYMATFAKRNRVGAYLKWRLVARPVHHAGSNRG